MALAFSLGVLVLVGFMFNRWLTHKEKESEKRNSDSDSSKS